MQHVSHDHFAMTTFEDKQDARDFRVRLISLSIRKLYLMKLAMNKLKSVSTFVVLCVLFTLSLTSVANGQQKADGSHDFDWEIGSWKSHLRRLVRPLTGSTTWVEYDGTTVVTKVWNGRANLVELDVTGPSGRIEALSIRLYNPDARQWSLNYSNSATGTMTAPVFGEFKNGRGEFFGVDNANNRTVLVKFIITCANKDTCHFEQSFSDDNGKTWELNWIADDTRIKG
jgi:hypothetical protein